MRVLAALSLLALLSACVPASAPRYHLGSPYQAGGAWHYPRESFDLDETGLGIELPSGRPWLTSNGESYDASAMAASHPTLQLPAIVRLTNLENGLSVVVRVNDRGTGNPRRLVEVTPRVATLLRIGPNRPTQMRLTVLPQESRTAIESIAGAPSLGIAVAPRGRIEATDLAPPPGLASRPGIAPLTTPADSQEVRTTLGPTRLPENLIQFSPSPGRMMVRLGTFDEYQYAMIQRARTAGLSPAIVQVWDGRRRRYRVEIGPLASVARADATQAQAMALGVPDARIVID